MLFCKPLEMGYGCCFVLSRKKANVVGVCTNGALAMLGDRSGLINRKNIRSPNAAGAQCAFHRDALAGRTSLLTKIVNFVKASAVKSRLFAICTRRWILTMRLCCSIFCGCPRQYVSSRVRLTGG